MASALARKTLFASEGRIQVTNLCSEVAERRNSPDAGGVEAIDHAEDGSVYMVVFIGTGAKDRALECAHAKFSEVRVSW